jgi:hypothetical protein
MVSWVDAANNRGEEHPNPQGHTVYDKASWILVQNSQAEINSNTSDIPEGKCLYICVL